MNVLLLSGALVASIAGAHAQEIDWKQVDTAFGRPAAGVRRCPSLRISAHRSYGDS